MLGLGLQILSGLFSANTLKKLSFDGLLSGAWFHKKALTDEVVDETPNVDTSRTWHKARALQFTGSEYVETDGLQIPNNPDDTFRIDFEFISGDDGQVLIICDGRSATDVNSFVVIHNDLGKIRFKYLNKDLDSTNKTIPNTRYKGYVAYDPSSSGSEMSLFVDGNVTGGVIQTAARTHTSTTFDDITFGKNNLIGSSISYGTLGWIKFTFDNIVTAEYAFEEGEGTTCYNRVMNNFHGTINNATISTFRVEDVRITNGDQGTFLNTDGYSPLNVYTSDFSSIKQLSEFKGTGAAAQSVGGVDDAYKFTLSGGNDPHIAEKGNIYEYGMSYTVSFDYYIPSGQTITGLVGPIQLGNTGSTLLNVTGSWQSESIDIVVREDGVGNSNDRKVRFYAHNGTTITFDADDDVFYLKNIVITQVNVYVPRLKDNTTDVLGNPLTYKGQVAQPLSLVNSNGSHWGNSDTDVVLLSTISNLSDFSIAMYLYLDTSIASIGTSRTIGKDGSANGLHFANDRGYLRADGGTSGYIDFEEGSFSSSVFNSWQKLFVVRSNNKVKFYLGNEERTITETGSTGLDFSFSKINDGFGLGASLNYFALYSRALTESERNNWDHYNIPQQSLENHLVFSTGSNSTVYDLSGNNNHGTIRNTTLSNFWIKQNEFHWNLKKGFSEVYSFDGVDDNIIPDTPLSFTGDFFIDFDVFTLASEFYIISSGVEYFRISSGSLMFRVDSNINTITTDITTNTRYIGRLQRISGVITCTLNGVNYPVVTTNTTIDFSYFGSNGSASGYTQGIINYINVNNEYIATGINFPNATINGGLQSVKVPYTINGNYTNPAGKWHNDAETEINFPHTAKLQVINEQFDYKPFFYKNAQLDDATAAYSMRKVIADYEGPLVNVVRSSDLQSQDFYPDSRGDLDITAITNFVNEATPVLDDYSGAAAAYSLRKVRSAYTGSAIEVRRSSNGDTENIGFDANGDLDSTALLAFVNASGNAYTSDFRVIGDPPVDQEDMGETGGTGAGGQSIADVSDAYKFTQDGSTGIHRAVNPTNANIVGGDISISFEYYLPSGQTSDRILFRTNNAGDAQVDLTTTDAWTTYSTTFSGIAGDQFWFYSAIIGQGLSFTGNGFDHFYLKNIVVTQTDADGAVTTWYDQTQNDPVDQNNATQSDPAKMPLIVEAGDVVLENGKAAISGDLKSLNVAAAAIQDTFDIFAISKINTECYIADMRQGDVDGTMILGRRQIGWLFNGSTWLGNGSSVSTGTQILANFEVSSTSATYYEDGVSIETISHSVNTSANEGFRIDFLSGNTLQIQELIIFNSDQSANRTGIEANIGRYYNINGFADGRVATWYDQANANHATQATPDQQPLIVNDGVLVTENSKPAIDFDGVDDYFDTNLGTLTESSVFMLFRKTLGGSSGVFGGSGNRSLGYVRESSRHRVFYVNWGAENITDSRTSPFTELVSFFRSEAATTLDLFRDGVNKASLTSLGNTVINPTNLIGKLGGVNTYYFGGLMQELIFFDSSDQSTNRQDIEKNIADYYEITLSGNSGVESWVKNVSFADMYQTWYDYEYLHRLFANFEIPNKVFKVLAYTSELTADQRQQVYDYLQKNYHPIYTPYSTRVLADGGTLAAGQTNTLTIIDSI